MEKILVIDDERPIRSTLKEILEFEDFKVDTAEDGKQGLEMILANKYDLILSDIKMPKMDGMELLDALIEKGVETPVVMISGHGNVETAVEAIKKGAYDFIQKPLDLNRTLVTLRNALDRKEIVKEVKKLKRKVSKGKITEIIGESAPVLHIKEMINKVAATDARVFVTGGNGAGKELVARQLHEKSSRAKCLS
jgi:DNA-binding NtrC family response regulator